MLISEITTPNVGDLTQKISEETGIKASVIESLLTAHNGDWFLMEAEPIKNRIAVLVSPLFQQTVSDKAKQYPQLQDRVTAFIQAKIINPGMSVGTHDKFFAPNGFFATAIPKVRHAHIFHNVIIVYTLNNNQLRLYGVYNHDDLGIGMPGNRRLQKQKAKELSNLRF